MRKSEYEAWSESDSELPPDAESFERRRELDAAAWSEYADSRRNPTPELVRPLGKVTLDRDIVDEEVIERLGKVAIGDGVVGDAASPDGPQESPEKHQEVPSNDPPRLGAEGPVRQLASAEELALRRYTDIAYEEVSSNLWSGSLDQVKETAAFAHDLSSAIEGLSREKGIVYRGWQAGRPLPDLDRYEPGSVVVEDGYVSASHDPESEFGGEVLWVIESKNGRSIPDDLSVHPSEHEVLFDHFSRFEVLSKTFEPDIGEHGRWLIYMEEVDGRNEH